MKHLCPQQLTRCFSSPNPHISPLNMQCPVSISVPHSSIWVKSQKGRCMVFHDPLVYTYHVPVFQNEVMHSIYFTKVSKHTCFRLNACLKVDYWSPSPLSFKELLPVPSSTNHHALLSWLFSPWWVSRMFITLNFKPYIFIFRLL